MIIPYFFIFSSNLNGEGEDPTYDDILAPAIYDCQGCQAVNQGEVMLRAARLLADCIARKASFEEAITHMKGIASLRPAKTTLDWADNDDVTLRLGISGCRNVTKPQHEIALAVKDPL